MNGKEGPTALLHRVLRSQIESPFQEDATTLLIET